MPGWISSWRPRPKLYRDIVIVLAYTGLRVSELCGLKLSVRDVVIVPETLAALDARFKLGRGKGRGGDERLGLRTTCASAASWRRESRPVSAISARMIFAIRRRAT